MKVRFWVFSLFWKTHVVANNRRCWNLRTREGQEEVGTCLVKNWCGTHGAWRVVKFIFLEEEAPDEKIVFYTFNLFSRVIETSCRLIMPVQLESLNSLNSRILKLDFFANETYETILFHIFNFLFHRISLQSILVACVIVNDCN